MKAIIATTFVGALALSAALFIATPAHGAEATPQSEALPEPLPPPDIDDPRTGETVTLDAEEAADAGAGEKVLPHVRTTPPADEQPKLPEKVRPTDELEPAVTIRTEGENTVEEYRRDGAIYMVIVKPKRGPDYTYLDTNGDGRLEGDPKEGPMQPVYYTLYEWE
jgi:hypothetical protein